MEIRVLRYFLEIAREGNMTRAAAHLHVSQPTLSRQLMDLEEELGKKLFQRGSRSVTLTSEGMLLRKRAEDILDMVDKTAGEFRALDELAGGEVRIGCAESHQIKYLARAIQTVKQKAPLFRYHLLSGNTEQVTERLDRGLFDFAMIVEPPDLSKYNYIELPESNTWGVIMRKDSPLAEKSEIRVQDLAELPLIFSRQVLKQRMETNELADWFGDAWENLNIVTTFNLIYNATVMAKQGMGYVISLDKLADTSEESALCFRPLSPRLESGLDIVWKKYQVFSPAAEMFLEELRRSFPPVQQA